MAMDEEIDALWKELDKDKEEERQALSELELEELKEALNLSSKDFNAFLARRDNYEPNLYDINVALDDRIVREYPARMSLFTAFILSDNDIFVSGPSASGKTALMDACSGLALPDDFCDIAGGSDKVIVEKHKDIKKAHWITIPEINKISETSLIVEVLKTWGEGKPYVYERTNKKGSGYIRFELPPKPFVFSRADESSGTIPIGVELMSRITEVTVDSSEEQTKAVMARQAENFINPFVVQHVDVVERACLKYHISTMPNFDVYVSPAANVLIKCVPAQFTSARRKFPQYKKNADGIARFFYKNRVATYIQEQAVLFVTPEDYFYNHLIFGQNLVDAALQCSPLQKTIMKIIAENGNSNKGDIQQNLRTYSINQTMNNIEIHLKHLANLGYVNVATEGRNSFYSVSNFYKKFEIKPNMSEIVDECKNVMESIDIYEPYADEYVDRFCKGDGLYAIEPFTGERVKITEYEFQNVLDYNNDSTRMNVSQVDEIIKAKPTKVSLFDY